MHSFLGVPILVRGEAWGNLYLTEKDAGELTQGDEDAVTVLADWAAIAIANSRLYRDVRQRAMSCSGRTGVSRPPPRSRGRSVA